MLKRNHLAHRGKLYTRLSWRSEWAWWSVQAQAATAALLMLVPLLLWAGLRAWPQWLEAEQQRQQAQALRRHIEAARAESVQTPAPTQVTTPACAVAAPCLAQLLELATQQGLSVQSAHSEAPAAGAAVQTRIRPGPSLQLDLRHSQLRTGERSFWRLMQSLQYLPFSVELLAFSLETQDPQTGGKAVAEPVSSMTDVAEATDATDALQATNALRATDSAKSATAFFARLRLQVLAAKPQLDLADRTAANARVGSRVQHSAHSDSMATLLRDAAAPDAAASAAPGAPASLGKTRKDALVLGAQTLQWLGRVAWQNKEYVLLRWQGAKGVQQLLLPVQSADYFQLEGGAGQAATRLRVLAVHHQRLRLEVWGQGLVDLEPKP